MTDLDAMLAEMHAERDAAFARREADPAMRAKADAKRAALIAALDACPEDEGDDE